MKKQVIVIFALISFCFSFVLSNFNSASADALTMPMIVNSVYAISQSLGLDWLFSGMTGNDVSSYLENEINSWLAGQSIVEKFGTEAVRLELGKYIVPATLYNGIVDFLSSFGEKNLDYSGNNALIYVKTGDWNYVPLGTVEVTATAVAIYYLKANTSTGESQEIKAAQWGKSRNPTNDGLSVTNDGTYITVNGLYSFNEGSTRVNRSTVLGQSTVAEQQTINADASSYTAPTVIDPSQSWVGEFYGVPDTNLQDLIDGALDDLADNNLVVDGEVIDTPVPPPTPKPIDPDTPLGDVPWEGLDTNLQNLYNQGLEETGKIGEAQDAITDAVSDQTGALEGAIADNAGVVSGAIDQAVSDIQDAIGDQTVALDQSLSATVAATESIANALEDEAINWQKFDLRGLFPFCIPFDIYNMLKALDASPTAPHVELPFIIESIGFSYTIDLDFSNFDTVAAIMRQMELIVYGIALAWATSKVIKW